MSYAWIALALGLLAFAPVTYVLSPRLRLRLNTRLAVEVVRFRTRSYQGHHSEPYLDDQFADYIAGDVIPYRQVNGTPPWPMSPRLRALPPVPDRLDSMVAEFAATLNLSGPGSPGPSDPPVTSRPGEPTAAQRQNLWQEHLAPHVYRQLQNATADDTVVTARDLEYMMGGDVYGGRGPDGYADEFDAITRRAHEAIAAICTSVGQVA